jgi:hypothetical protein
MYAHHEMGGGGGGAAAVPGAGCVADVDLLAG